jgi:hypothetical protein
MQESATKWCSNSFRSPSSAEWACKTIHVERKSWKSYLLALAPEERYQVFVPKYEGGPLTLSVKPENLKCHAKYWSFWW